MKGKLQKLEALRGFAAIYVFVGHLLLQRVTDKTVVGGFFLRLGQEAVMLFFIVSGFVVCYSTTKHADVSFMAYFGRRFRRIYPIFVLALLVSFCVVVLSQSEWREVDVSGLIGNLLMFQDFGSVKPGVWVQPFYGNTPLWSLSYEWWFYMMFFPIHRYIAIDHQIRLVAAISLLGWLTFLLLPNQISLFLAYFILWWTGVELARAYIRNGTVTFHSQRKSLQCVAAFILLSIVPVLLALKMDRELFFGVHPVLELRHFGATLLMLFVGLTWARYKWKGFAALLGIFAAVSPISYGIYVFHYPLAITASYLNEVPSLTLQVLAYAVITVSFAWLAEVPFQNFINRMYSRRKECLPTPISKPSPRDT